MRHAKLTVNPIKELRERYGSEFDGVYVSQQELKMKISIPSDMKSGYIHKTKHCGNLRIVKYNHALSVLVEFIDTGYERVAQSCHIRAGSVKDPFVRFRCGAGFMGDGPHKSGVKGKYTAAYIAWSGMIYRCYNDEFKRKHKTYKDCYCVDDWHNFQIFADWFESEVRKLDEVPKVIHVDKDIRVKGNKLYSPDTCMLVSASENTSHNSTDSFRFISPDGEIFETNNISKFCKGRDLRPKGLYGLKSGDLSNYKGWSVP